MADQVQTLNLWLPAYLRQKPTPCPAGVKDILLCVCDHFEPLHHADKAEALRRMAQWKTEFPKNIAPFRDADGVHPRHTFFYPIEQYDRDILNELTILNETGCYADFTLPSAPDPTQTRTINRLYYAQETPKPKSHDTGVQVRVINPGAPAPYHGDTTHPRFGDLLIVQGPLGLNWERRKFGLLPRLENADLTMVNSPRPDRMRLWLRQHIHVLGRPEWFFIKLHAHGAPPPNSGVFLGEPYREFHRHLAETYRENKGWRLHYVTARELVNILHAAEDGHRGNAGQFRDYRYKLPTG